MKTCPFCAEEIQDNAIKCRFCGEFLEEHRGRRMTGFPAGYGWGWGYEYKSKATLFGLPMIHIAQGINPKTGLPRVAKGIIAIGNIAIGIIAIGGFCFGGFALGGIGLGLFIIGGISFGVVAMGGIALALYFAVGGMAISAVYALGGLAVAPYAISSMGADPECVRMVEKWWPGIRKIVSEIYR